MSKGGLGRLHEQGRIFVAFVGFVGCIAFPTSGFLVVLRTSPDVDPTLSKPILLGHSSYEVYGGTSKRRTSGSSDRVSSCLTTHGLVLSQRPGAGTRCNCVLIH